MAVGWNRQKGGFRVPHLARIPRPSALQWVATWERFSLAGVGKVWSYTPLFKGGSPSSNFRVHEFVEGTLPNSGFSPGQGGMTYTAPSSPGSYITPAYSPVTAALQRTILFTFRPTSTSVGIYSRSGYNISIDADWNMILDVSAGVMKLFSALTDVLSEDLTLYSVTAATPIVAGQWYTVAVSVDATVATLWLDGEVLSLTHHLDANSALYCPTIGRWEDSAHNNIIPPLSSRTLVGEYGDAYCWTAALSVAEIESMARGYGSPWAAGDYRWSPQYHRTQTAAAAASAPPSGPRVPMALLAM